MAYVNNGTERSLKVSVYKKVGGNYVQGYPKVYDGQNSWGNPSYPTLTDTENRQLSDAEFSNRLYAFKLYVENIESGADFDTDVVGDGAIRSNTGVCLPTTTTTQQPVWSFAVKYSTTAILPSACEGIVDVAYSSKQFPGVGDILYADSALSVPWAKGGFVLITSPAIYGTKLIIVAVVSGTYSIGEILDTANGFDCSSITTIPVTTTTTTSSATFLTCSNVQVAFDNYLPGAANEWSIGIVLPEATLVDTIFEVKWSATRTDAYGLVSNATAFVEVPAGQTYAYIDSFTGLAQSQNEAWTVTSVRINDITPGTQFVSNC